MGGRASELAMTRIGRIACRQSRAKRQCWGTRCCWTANWSRYDPDGTSSFPDLQTALSAGRDGVLFFYVFDLLHLDGWDLRPSHLVDRKTVLASLAAWGGQFRS